MKTSDIISFAMGVPALAGLAMKAKNTGKVDKYEALKAVSSLSPDLKKCTNIALDSADAGESLPQIAGKLMNVGEVSLFGKTINTRTMKDDLREYGGKPGSILANILDWMPTAPPEQVVSFGDSASDLKTWINS